jgi:polyhydroxybutyrate depolymerase
LIVSAYLHVRTAQMNEGPVQVGVSRHEIKVGGLTRTYRLYVPASAVGHPVPLLLALHGRLGTGEAQAKLSNLDAIADHFGFVVVYPDGIRRSWNAGHHAGPASRDNIDDVGFAAVLIDHLETSLAIDSRRVYAAGMSAGGILAHRLACELSDRIRGIAAVAGPMAVETARTCNPGRPVTVIQFHGTSDLIVPWAGGVTRGGGTVVSVEETVKGWLIRDGCREDSFSTSKWGDTTCTIYGPGSGDRRVALCRTEGGGHTWPGGKSAFSERIVGTTTNALNASEYLWKFLEGIPE